MSEINCMGQLSVNIADKLYFLTGANFLNKVKYCVKHVPPEISLETKNNRILIAGIESVVTLNISMGTYTMDQVGYNNFSWANEFRQTRSTCEILIRDEWFQDPILILRSSDGLKISLADETNWSGEIKINLNDSCGEFKNNYSVDLNVCSAFPSQTDGSVIVHKVICTLFRMLKKATTR